MTSDPQTWQVAGSAAELYERYLVPAVTLPWGEDLVDRVAPARGDHVLDVACGTGVVARLAASVVGDAGRVAAVDVNREMLAVARSRQRDANVRIEWHEASADSLPFGDDAFNVAFCQLGLQFFPDREAALREMRRVLAPGGRLAASVFTSIERNPAAHALAEAVDRRCGAGAAQAKRSEHSLADRNELRELFEAAGFVGTKLETASQSIRFTSVDEWVEIQFAATPLAALLAVREPAEREECLGLVSADVGTAAAAFVSSDGFTFPQEVHVALATA